MIFDDRVLIPISQLGNNRGNKYSKKNVHHSPTSSQFWNYSIDQFAFHDIPDSIDYILSTTHQPSLSYIGFSQGTAQGFATLSIHPNLNEKVDVFIALAPAMAPPDLGPGGIVTSFIKASPEVLFLMFGRKSILSSTTMWQALLYPAIFTWVIDLSLKYLFGWHSKNMTEYQKLAAYPHLFSFSSTKSVVHWLQIIRNGTFQMYDDEVQAPLSIVGGSKYYKVAKYPTRNILTPVFLIYGGSDSLVDIKVMLKELPRHTVAKEIRHYEHLDFLWASDVDKMVFPHVLEALERHASAPGQKNESPYKVFRNKFAPSPLALLPSYSEDERGASIPRLLESADIDGAADVESDTPERNNTARSITSPRVKPANNKVPVRSPPPKQTPQSPVTSQITDKSTRSSRPEGWWSSDEVAGTSESPSPSEVKGGRTVAKPMSALNSQDENNGLRSHKSQRSIESMRSSDASFGHRGITFGHGKAPAAAGIITEGTAAQTLRSVGESSPDVAAGSKKLKKRK